MSVRTLLPWYDRVFSFDLTLAAVPGLIERLRGTPARLRHRLLGVPTEQLTAAPAGTWSIKENLGHLGDLELLWRTRVADILIGREMMQGGDLEDREISESRHNDRSLQLLHFGFEAERRDLVTRLEGLDETSWLLSAIHPRFQLPMRLLDLAYFIAEHDDHHLAAITALLRFDAGSVR